MTGLLAFSLSNSVTEVGALAAFAALVGIAILSLLVFSQAREIKRLRDWAGRAPERAVEMEQRVSADAAARVRGAGPAQPGAPAPVRVVPRKTPLVSAPVSTAVNATVAAVVPGTVGSAVGPNSPPVGEAVAASSPAVGAPGPNAPTGPSAEAGLNDAAGPNAEAGSSSPPVAAGATPSASGSSAGLSGPVGASDFDSRAPGGGGAPPLPSDSHASSQPNAVGQSAAAAVPASGTRATVSPRSAMADPSSLPSVSPDSTMQDSAIVDSAARDSAAPVPATAAARAAGGPARAPLPPSPAAPAPPGPTSAQVFAGGAVDSEVSSKPAARPPGAVAAAQGVASRAVAAPAGATAAPRSPASMRGGPNVPATSAGARVAARGPGAPGGSGPKYFKPERSPRRAIALIIGGVLVGVLVLVLVVSALKGGGGSPARINGSSTASETPTRSPHKAPGAVASRPAETAVVVLNGTSTPGLAHHLAADLQQGGYTLAAASAGVPPGSHATTVVQYVRGHRADAQEVAKALDVTRVQALEPAIASLAGSAAVVVLAGADQASQLGGGGAQSNGEPAAGTGGEGTAAGQ